MQNDLFDQKQLERLQRLAGDRFKDVVVSFEKDINRMLPELRRAAIDNSMEDLYEMAHALKSVSGNLAAKRMSDMCKELEAYAKNGNIEGADTKVKNIEDESLLIIKTLRQIE